MPYKLTYFSLRGRGEPIRLLFALAGVEYEDVRVQFADWPAVKSSTPWGQLPILEVDGQTIAQTSTIARFLARRFKLIGSNPFEEAKVEELLDAGNDLNDQWVKFFLESDEAKKAELKNTFASEHIPKYFAKFDKIQNDNGGNFLVGQSATLADVWISNLIEKYETTVDPNALAPYPNLKKLKEAFFALPNVKAWVDKRPPPP